MTATRRVLLGIALVLGGGAAGRDLAAPGRHPAEPPFAATALESIVVDSGAVDSIAVDEDAPWASAGGCYSP
jgi:hypothetical protein